MALTKKDIVDRMQAELGFLRNRSIEITESLLELIKATLESGDDVLVSGFGKFCVKEKKARKGRNPATGEDLMLKPRRVVTFKWSGQLREKVDGKRILRSIAADTLATRRYSLENIQPKREPIGIWSKILDPAEFLYAPGAKWFRAGPSISRSRF